MTRIKGRVTKVNQQEITGWCYSPTSPEPLEVVLLLDGVEINRTWATQKTQQGVRRGKWIRFRFGMSSVWEHMRPGQKLSVKTGDHYLAFQGETQFDVVEPEAEISDTHITEMLSAGWVINKFGRLHQPRLSNPKWKAKSHKHFSQISDALRSEFGLECFALYGVCLGFAREGTMMRHDLDLDVGYLSSQTRAQKVQEEFEAISRYFISVDRVANPFAYKLQFPGRGISLTPSWFDSDGTFFTTYGFVGVDDPADQLQRSDVVPAQTVPWFDDKTLTLPANPAKMARYLYGPYWMYPDTGWKWFSEYRNRPEIAAARLSDQTVTALQALRTATWPGK